MELETVSQNNHIADRRVGFFRHGASRKMRDLSGQAKIQSGERTKQQKETKTKPAHRSPKCHLTYPIQNTQKGQETTQRKGK